MVADDEDDVVVVVRDDDDGDQMKCLLGISKKLVKYACHNACPMYPTTAVKTRYPYQLV